MDNNLIPYQPVISDIKNLIAAGQNVAYNAANRAMIMTYWNIGKRIVEEEQSGAERAEYGKRLISILSDELTKEFGSNQQCRGRFPKCTAEISCRSGIHCMMVCSIQSESDIFVDTATLWSVLVRPTDH